MLRYLSRAIYSPAPSPILDLEKVRAGLGTGFFSPDAAGSRSASWQWLLQLYLSGRPPPYKSRLRTRRIRFSCQKAGGGRVMWFPNGELVGDRFA